MLPFRMLLPIRFGSLVALVVWAAAAIDEHATVPLFAALSVSGSIMISAFLIGRKAQKIMDQLEEQSKHLLAQDVTIDLMRKERAIEFSSIRRQILDSATDTRNFPDNESSFHILLIDDDKADRLILKRKLSGMFYVQEADTLTAANRIIATSKAPFDCVLLDLSLPDTQLRNTASDFVRHNPNVLCIIVLTGNGDPELAKAAMAAGVDDVWIKGKDDVDAMTMCGRMRDAIWNRRK